MTHAFNLMIGFGKSKISGRLYEKFMLDFSQAQSEKQKGKSPGNKGKKAPNWVREKLSKAKIGKPSNRKGCNLSDVEKQHISNINKGKKKITDGKTVKWLLKDNIIPDGFYILKNIVNIAPKYRFRYIFNIKYTIDLKNCKFTSVHDKWITNGTNNRMISFDNKIPFGWKLGKTTLKKGFWINNGSVSQKWFNCEIPVGWQKGRVENGKFKFITNGKDNMKISNSEKIPEGWYYGLTKTMSEKGKQNLINSNKGKVYITDGNNTKQWNREKEIPNGWWFGRAEKGNKISITNGIENKIIDINCEIPSKWRRGVTKKTGNRYT